MLKRSVSYITIVLMVLVMAISVCAASFERTGRIRAVISETAGEDDAYPIKLFGNSSLALKQSTKRDFYFVYFDEATGRDTWLQMPTGIDLAEFSEKIVRVSGLIVGDRLSRIDVARLSDGGIDQLIPPPTVGIYKTVVVPLTIQPNAQPPATLSITPEVVRNVFFDANNSVNKFFAEASYGKLQFAGVIEPRIDVIPMTIQATMSSNCQDQIISEFTQIVRQRLLSSQIDMSNGSVDLGIILFNDLPGCPPYPFTTRGALGARGVPLWLWMPESWFNTGPAIMTHEIGHALGANHPAAFRCVDPNNTASCVNTPNVNDRDMMTYAAAFHLMPNNYERLRWGWHPPSVFDFSSFPNDQTLDLFSPLISTIKDGFRQRRFVIRTLNAPYAGGWAVFPEARTNRGVFERYQAADEEFRLGTTIRIGHLDYTHPEALSVLIDPNETPTLDDAPLRINQSVSIGGVTITTERESTQTSGTRIRISQNP